MAQNSSCDDYPLGNPASFRVGSAQSRAAARAMLEARNMPASLSDDKLSSRIRELTARLGLPEDITADELQQDILGAGV